MAETKGVKERIDDLLGVVNHARRKREREEALMELYRRTFNTPHGRLVLADILNRAGVFKVEIKTDEERILSNFGRDLLYHCGAWQSMNVHKLVATWLGFPYRVNLDETEQKENNE